MINAYKCHPNIINTKHRNRNPKNRIVLDVSEIICHFSFTIRKYENANSMHEFIFINLLIQFASFMGDCYSIIYLSIYFYFFVYIFISIMKSFQFFFLTYKNDIIIAIKYSFWLWLHLLRWIRCIHSVDWPIWKKKRIQTWTHYRMCHVNNVKRAIFLL